MIIGYIFTAVYIVLLGSLIAATIMSRREISKAFKDRIGRSTILIAILITLFFVIFSINYVSPVEQLYFDENIYQGIALNILHNGNALWCQYGTGYLSQCPLNQIYHDPVEWSFYIAIAFFFFGTGIATSYGLELFIGAVSIMLVFLLGSLLAGKRIGLLSALVFSLIPELFIWSRTQAVPDLGFMTFSILTFLCYSIYVRQRSPKTLMMLLSALGITIYMRSEGIFLIPILIILHVFSESKFNLKERFVSFMSSNVDSNAAILFIFFICLIPQVYYLEHVVAPLDYGSGTICNIPSNKTFSVGDFLCNIGPNTQFFLGNYNSTGYYPTYFSIETTIIALIGLITLIAIKRKGKLHMILLLGLWILVYYLFFDFFYAGSVTYGVDVRFMLELYPAIAILAAIGIDDLSKLAGHMAKRITRKKIVIARVSGIALVILLIIFVFYPFVAANNTITISPQNMPQEGGPLTATNFIYSNYQSVPASCLVFTFTPDVWYGLNRSAAQVGYVDSSDINFTGFASHYSCYVFDYGYWCVVPPFHSSTCKVDTTQYSVEAIVSSSPASGGSGNLTLYKIVNYTLPALRNSSYT